MKPYPLIARFVKINKSDGSQDFDESYWVVVSQDEKKETILSKTTVKELITSDPDLKYDTIATREFGVILIKRMRKRLDPLKAFW